MLLGDVQINQDMQFRLSSPAPALPSSQERTARLSASLALRPRYVRYRDPDLTRISSKVPIPQILTHIRCHMDDARVAVETGVDGV